MATNGDKWRQMATNGDKKLRQMATNVMQQGLKYFGATAHFCDVKHISQCHKISKRQKGVILPAVPGAEKPRKR
jgi:hypothetical protein